VAQFTFVQVIVVAAIVAIVAQCSVYLVRWAWGMAAARQVLRWSLGGFAFVTIDALIWGAATGELAQGLSRYGWQPLLEIALFIGFTMFISYFMGSRYLVDELERAKASDGRDLAEG
jgi:hypothetical protein